MVRPGGRQGVGPAWYCLVQLLLWGSCKSGGDGGVRIAGCADWLALQAGSEVKTGCFRPPAGRQWNRLKTAINQPDLV